MHMHILLLVLPLLLIGCATTSYDPNLKQRLQQRDNQSLTPAGFSSSDAQQLLELCISVSYW